MQPLRWSVLALGVLSMVLWLTSYSWLVGFIPPTQWISRSASPWWIAEIAAAGIGTVSLVAGLVLARTPESQDRRIPLVAASLGGFAMVASVLSIAMPA